jgi:Icc-related predicted phosphoesterase
MRLLLFSDLHCDAVAARSLQERAADVDVVVGAGDFANVRRGISTTIDVLRAIDCPAVLVPGNGESHEELVEACRGWSGAHVLHGSGTTIDGLCFYGLGGGVPVTPFGSWSCDLTEAEATRLLVGCPEGCVLVSHSPPYGAVDSSSRGALLGSRALRATVEHKRPALVVCGHIHECAGRSSLIGATPVVNAGPRGIVWNLPTGSCDTE